jgi:hypothetical protein
VNVIKLLLKLISLFLYRNKSGQNDARDLKMKIREKKLAKIVDGYTSPSRGVEHASRTYMILYHILYSMKT